MHIALVSLLHGNTVLVDDIWLIDVEHLNVVGQCFSSNCKLSIAKWTLSGYLVQLDVVTNLSEINFFIKYKRFLHQII